MYNFVTLSQNIHTSLSWKLKGKKREEIKKRKGDDPADSKSFAFYPLNCFKFNYTNPLNLSVLLTRFEW
ncbi:hypothetical protein Csa_012050 [Cucumis sativus]|uniref:Uncharacterized protein n=1 Tax=Cucumis sativus TaxID=3659 RepID=A0A0A0KYW7_CUCSA|nr:hypothetical protein Csa_012050 [Cucumis sativus]